MKLLIVFLSLLPLVAAQEAAAQKPAAQEPAKTEESKPAEAAAPAAVEPGEKTLTGSVDVGFRFNSGIAGNKDVFRSIVNLGEGPKLFGFDLRIDSKTHKYFDRITMFGQGWGGDPDTTARIDALKERFYDLRFDYRNIAYFNFLPSFANSMLQSGILRTERGSDLRKRLFDADLKLFPGRRIIPFLAFSQDDNKGRGITTFYTDGNMYPIAETVHDSTSRVHGGASFEFSKWHLTVEEGATNYRENDNTQNTQPNTGDRTGTVLGQTLQLNTLTEMYRTHGSGYFTKAQGTFNPCSWIDLSGQYLFSNPSITSTYLATATGNFVNLQELAFYNSFSAGVASAANQPHKAGSFYLEVRPFSRVRIMESVSGDTMNVPSSYAITEVSTTTPAFPDRGYTRFQNSYNRHQLEGMVDITNWLTLRAGFRNVWGDLTTRAPIVNSVEFEQAKLRQDVFLGGLSLRFGQKLRITTDTEIGNAYKSYFRTSLHDYEKGSARFRYQAFASLGFTGSFMALYNENPTTGVSYDFRLRTASLGFFWNPNNAKRYSLLGDYTFSSLKSNIGYYEPQSGIPAISDYRDNAHTATMVFDYSAPGGKYAPHLMLGGSMFKSAGSRASAYMQPLVRLQLPIYEHANFFTEWRYYGYGETNYVYEGFRSHIFQMGLRLIR